MKPISSTGKNPINFSTTRPASDFLSYTQNNSGIKEKTLIADAASNSQSCTYKVFKDRVWGSSQVSIEGDISSFPSKRPSYSRGQRSLVTDKWFPSNFRDIVKVTLNGSGKLNLGMMLDNPSEYVFPASITSEKPKIGQNYKKNNSIELEVEVNDINNDDYKIYGSCAQYDVNGKLVKRTIAKEAPNSKSCSFGIFCKKVYN